MSQLSILIISLMAAVIIVLLIVIAHVCWEASRRIKQQHELIMQSKKVIESGDAYVQKLRSFIRQAIYSTEGDRRRSRELTGE